MDRNDDSFRTSARRGAVKNGRVGVREDEHLGLIPLSEGPARLFPASVLSEIGRR